MPEQVYKDSNYKFEFSNAILSQLHMQARRRLYSQRPDIWARDVLDVTLWSKQVEVALSIVNNHSTMVAAGHGVGKSYLTAVLACWWIDTHPIGEARVLSTAPTSAQVRGIVWREMQLLHTKAAKRYREFLDAEKAGEPTAGLPDHPLPGYITSSATWRNFDGLELGSGRTPPAGREDDAFQGIHGGVFAIADEAVGVSAKMIGTLQNNTTANADRILMIANPTNPASAMGQIWNDDSKNKRWKRITISVLESPHFTDEGKGLPDSVMKYMTDDNYVETKREEYGEDSANWKARILGQWAMDSGMIVFLDETLEIGLATTVIPDTDAPVHVGFDVSRSEKGDWSYLYTAQEGWVYQTVEWAQDDEGNWNERDLETPVRTEKRGVRLRFLDRWRGLPFQPVHNAMGQLTVDIAANQRVHNHMIELGATELRIDADGMGAMMFDAMVDVNYGDYEMYRMKGNDPSPDRNAWYNARAYTFMEFARRMRAGEIDIERDTDAHPLVRELGALEYKFAAGLAESILILSKAEMKSKGIKSPDTADAANYAVAWMEMTDSDSAGTVFEYDMSTMSGHDIYDSRNSFW